MNSYDNLNNEDYSLPNQYDDHDWQLNQNQWDEIYSKHQNQWNQEFYDYSLNVVPRNAVFEQFYRCYPAASLNNASVENGDKIIMPSSALDSLAQLNIEYPMLFELKNTYDERTTHCGVLEFTADEGIVFLPNWMMEDMLLQEGDIVSLKSKSLLKGKFVKFQPHSKDFLDILNPKAMLETSLRRYSCLTTGRTIMIPYDNKKYYIDVVETKPSPAVSIIETDCEVDFAPPLDYKEPEKPLPIDQKEAPQVEQEPATKTTPRVIPFSGSGRRLDGKLVEQTITPIDLKQQQTENKTMSSNRTCGKLVFGSNANASSTNVETKPKVSPQFQAFTGKKYSLKN